MNGLNPGARPMTRRQHYIVTSSLIGWAHSQNDPWLNHLSIYSITNYIHAMLLNTKGHSQVAEHYLEVSYMLYALYNILFSSLHMLQWRHNRRNSVLNHQPHHCLLNRLFRCRWKKTSAKLRVTGLCAGNSPVTDEFPEQMASNAENVSIWWRHHDFRGLKVWFYFSSM